MEQAQFEQLWRAMLTGDASPLRKGRRLYRLIPSSPRCKLCNAPFRGLGAPFMRLWGKRPSDMNPRMCDLCVHFAGAYRGGAEVEMTLLFADVRGSTALGQRMSPREFSVLMNRFYAAATDILIGSDALIDKLVGDEVIGLYFPGLAGADHPRRAIEAAKDILLATGHKDAKGPWLPVGIGVHTGVAFFGVVGSEGVTDVTALGDAVNMTARLSSLAGPGEILITDSALEASGLREERMETRHLELKGRSEPVEVHAIRVKL